MAEHSHSRSPTASSDDWNPTSDLRFHVSNVDTHLRDPNSDSVSGSNGARYKLMSPAKLPISRSACITIPPGLSPTSFLESPVLLSNIKAEPSPTTGSFFKSHLMNGSGFSSTTNCSNSNTFEERSSSCFEFKPYNQSNSVSVLSSSSFPVSTGFNHQSYASLPMVNCEIAASKEANLSVPMNILGPRVSVHAVADNDEINQGGQTRFGGQASQTEYKDTGPSVTVDRSSEDGYNWRKYGQKIVKGSEFPRSYYKCTHPNCEVKKIFERSYDGHITEIVYKGTHDHPKPQPSRRFTAGALMSIQEEKTDKVSSCQEDHSTINGQRPQTPNIEPNGTPVLSPKQANDDSLDGAVSQLNTIDEVDEDDPYSKRRKMEVGGYDITPVVKPIREPRVVVQTVSEVDILDDGYRWRKYGQKVVRGNPNPRSYYKCTNAGCPVRKHVERASHDPKAVITTYEGKHNHDVPTAKSSSHDTSAATSANAMSRIIRSEENNNDTISLDLGVGIGYGAENRSDEQQQIRDPEHFQSQAYITSSNLKAVQQSPISMCYGSINGNMNLYGSKDSSNQYPQNLGRILLGP